MIKYIIIQNKCDTENKDQKIPEVIIYLEPKQTVVSLFKTSLFNRKQKPVSTTCPQPESHSVALPLVWQYRQEVGL